MKRILYILVLLPMMALAATPPKAGKPEPGEKPLPGAEQLASAQDEIIELSKRMQRGQDFTISTRNPFVSYYTGVSTPHGSYTAEGIWNYITEHLPLSGVNIDDEDAKASTLVMGDVELEVGKPLPKYVLDAPVEVVLLSITEKQATFRIVITDPNADQDKRVEPQNFALKFDGLVPKVEQKSKFVLTPLGGKPAASPPPGTGDNGSHL